MKYGYPEIREGTKCKTCLGCNRLEDLDFTGVFRCESYIGGIDDGNDGRGHSENNEAILREYR